MEIIREPLIFDVPDEEQEIWIKRKANKGDHIKVDRGLYTHHGVYISNDEVIHFTGSEEDSVLDWSKPEVIQTDLSYFLKDGELEVKEYTDDELQDLYPVDHIIAYARACLGDKGYNLVFNNCEHFANVCTLGRFRSRQVEKVFDVIIGRRKKDMGLLGKIGGFVKGLFGGRSSGGSRSTSNTNTTYEPDKVKIAEIESQTKIRLANMEKERIQLSTDAQLEIMEQEYRFKVGLEEAKALGFNNIANTIVGMQEKLNEVAQKRVEIIEKGSLQVVREIENFYLELKGKITEDNQIYSEEKFPKLLEILGKYDENSPAYKLYFKRVEDDMDAQLRSFNKQIDGIAERQSKIIDSFLNSKDKMIDQTAMITNGLIDKMIASNVNIAELEATNDIRKLGSSQNNRLLGE
jgi:NC domain.